MMDFPLPCLPAGETPFFSRSNYAEQNARQMSTICLVCDLAARPMIVTRTKLHYLGCAYHDTAFHVWIRNHDVVCVCILYACKLDVQHACFACCIVYMYNPHNMFFFAYHPAKEIDKSEKWRSRGNELLNNHPGKYSSVFWGVANGFFGVLGCHGIQNVDHT